MALTAACGGVKGSSAGSTAAEPIRIGYVSPQTGALAPFGEADSYVVGALESLLSPGLPIGGARVCCGSS